MFFSTAHAAGSDSLPLPDSVDPAIFRAMFWGIGAAIALFILYKIARRVIRR